MSILLEDAHLDGRLFDGGWQKAAASYEVIEPATGNTLGRAGQADAALVRVAAASARKAQAAKRTCRFGTLGIRWSVGSSRKRRALAGSRGRHCR